MNQRIKRIFLLLALLVPMVKLQAQTDSSQERGKISGQVFFDYFYNFKQKDTTKKDFNGFQLRRVFFTYDYSIATNFDTRFRLEADQIALTKNDKIGIAVKEAYLTWKNIFGQSNLAAGLSPTPTWDVSEREWNYRSLEKTIMDLQGIAARTDLGIDLKGKLGEEAPVNYWFKVGNNSGNAPEKDKFKRVYGMFHFKPTSQVNLTAYADYATAQETYDAFDDQFKKNNSVVLAGFLDYHEENKYVIGVEVLHRTIQNNFGPLSDPLQNQNSNGISLFAWNSMTEDVRLVVRYDIYDPNASIDNDGSSLFIGAIDYMPASNVHVMPNIYIQSYQADIASDIVGRLTFHYDFH